MNCRCIQIIPNSKFEKQNNNTANTAFKKSGKNQAPRRGIEPRSPAIYTDLGIAF